MQPALIIGDWEIDPIDGQIRRSGETRRLRPKTMAVLLCLAEHPGELVERNDIIARVWGRQLVTDEPLTTCIAELRRTLDDQAHHPLYIQTVPKRGYRLVATVAEAGADRAAATSTDQTAIAAAPATRSEPPSAPRPLAKRPNPWMAVAVGILVLSMAWIFVRAPDDPAEQAAPAPVNAPPQKPTIAVLPFLNMSPDPENDYFGDGIAEEILNSLTKIDGLRVRSRTSSFALKDQNLDAAGIAERLKVSHILEGSIRRSREKIRITAQLIDVRADTHIWSVVFEKPMQNIFEIQGDIATRVSEALEIALNLEQKMQLGDVGTTHTEAYNLYLRGRQLLARRTMVSITAAAENFSRALELDPQYAQAYLGLADANLLLPQYNNRPGTDYLPKALQAVETALEIKPDLGEAYATLGGIRDEMQDIVGAEQAFRIALQRAPRYPTTYHWYGFLLNRIARLDEADRMLRLAIEQDPLSNLLRYSLSSNLLALGRFDESEAGYREILARDPEFSWAYEGMGELNWNGRGQLDVAAEWYEKAIRYDPDSSYFHAILGTVYLDSGNAVKAAQWIDKAMRVAPESFSARSHKALLHLYLGQNETAYDVAADLLVDDPRNYLALLIVRNHDLANGRPGTARTYYASAFSELLADEVRVDAGNFQMAVDFALVLRQTGEDKRAGLLLDRAWEFARDYPRNGLPYRLSDVKILALRGRNEEAFNVLAQSIDSGWRPYWWLFLKYDPALESVREHPRFRQLVDRLESEASATVSIPPSVRWAAPGSAESA